MIGQLKTLKLLVFMECTGGAVTVLDNLSTLRNLDQLSALLLTICPSMTKLRESLGATDESGQPGLIRVRESEGAPRLHQTTQITLAPDTNEMQQPGDFA